MTQYWGYHCMLNCAGCEISTITSRENILAFKDALIQAIEMKAYGEPILEHIIAPTPEEAGFSLLQMIETSNIAAHFVDKSGALFLDVFSCKHFDIEVVKATVMEYFGAKKIESNWFARQAPQL